MESLKGTIEKIVYRNNENGYIIAKISLEKKEDKLTTIVGNMASVNIGEDYELKGEWVNNSKFGWQFNFKDYQLISYLLLIRQNNKRVTIPYLLVK